ncbi:hypothetical protein FRC07_001542 [Ceratobasidium sp. 392]|nr:hypothetical protein FRC07_001542 [Ceratobasidium sp. 392]
MDVDQWHERVDWGTFREEKSVIQELDDSDVQAEHGVDDERRIFRLTDFFVYNRDTMKLATLQLERLDGMAVAGYAVPMIPDDNAGEDDDEELEETYGRNIRLSAVTKVEHTYLDVSDAGQDGIYILTSYAWYLLERPVGFYYTPYQEPFRQFRLALVVLRRAYEHPEERLLDFIGKFRRISKRIEERHTRAAEWGYPALHPADLQDSSATIARNVMFYIDQLANALHGEEDDPRRASLIALHGRLRESPAISGILKGALSTIRRRDNAPLTDSNNLSSVQPPRVGGEGDPYDVTFDADEFDEDMDEDRPTRPSAPARRICVTPTVERIARQVFSSSLNLVGKSLPDVTWRKSRAEGTPVAPDAKLRRGRCIMVTAGIDEALPQQDWAFNNERTMSTNTIANNYWFAHIMKIATNNEQLHVRWFDHSAKSDLLKEFERPMELFLTNRCAWVSRKHVQRLVDVSFLGEDEAPSDREQNYYVRFIRDHPNGAFIRIRPSDYELDLTSTNCAICDQAQLQDIHFENDELRLGRVTLHKGEFFVMNPPRRSPWFNRDKDEKEPGCVVQIAKIYYGINNGRHELQALYLRGFERVEALRKRGLVDQAYLPCEGRPVQDERRLCLMNADEWMMVVDTKAAQKAPIRKCFVRHADDFDSIDEMNEWLSRSALHYIVDLQGKHTGVPAGDEFRRPRVRSVDLLPQEVFDSLPACTKCEDDSMGYRVTKMRMLDLFSGAGGLSKGLVQAGICEPKCAVDHDASACATYRSNFRGVKAIHGDVNVVLSRTLLAASNEENNMAAPDDQERSSLLPERHEIDFICGGPPCQSFSGANRFKRDDDPRTAMVAAVLSAVEHYQPKYFLIENVPDALTHKIAGPVPRAGSADSDDSVDPPPNHIEQGILRFLMRVTLDLGYSFRVGVLQASQYGAPQRRRRAYILGARASLTLPELPLATHRVVTSETGMKLPTGGYLDALAVRSGFTLHPAVTIWDAISDLKPFDWRNPHALIPETQQAKNEARNRRVTLRIPSCRAVHEERCEVGPIEEDEAAGYREDMPVTLYQMQARKNAQKPANHYTSSFKSEVFVERVVTIPLSANADHRTLPEVLRRGDFLSNIFGSGGASGYYRGAFGRYDRKDQFATILTSLRPAKKNGFCIHPEQKRMLTMRELARAQGFPDDFVFSGSVDEVNRQIGNAVVVQVSHAIGREIKKAMIKDRLL